MINMDTQIKPINDGNRSHINEFIRTQWFSTDMIIRGEVVDMTKVEGFVLYEGEIMIGLITYRITGKECEITSFDSLIEGRGNGTCLMNKVLETAKNKHCIKVKLITTNDNMNAIRFYQKRGFDMVRLYHNSMKTARKLKPSIPLIGENDIPLRHEIEFETRI